MTSEFPPPTRAGASVGPDDDTVAGVPPRLQPSAGVTSAPPPRTASTARPVPPTPGPVPRGPRRARLGVKRVDPWSVLKLTFVYSLAALIVLLIAVIVLWGVLDAMGVFDSVDRFVRDVNGGSGGIGHYLSFRWVVGAGLVVGAVNVVLFTAFATLGAFVYNLCSELVGGIEVTLTERD